MGALSRIAQRFGVEAFSSKADRGRLDAEAEKTAEEWSARLAELETAEDATEPVFSTTAWRSPQPDFLWTVHGKALRDGGSGARVAGRKQHGSGRPDLIVLAAGDLHAIAEVKMGGRPQQPRRTQQIGALFNETSRRT